MVTSHSVGSIELYNRVMVATDRSSRRRKAASPTIESILRHKITHKIKEP